MDESGLKKDSGGVRDLFDLDGDGRIDITEMAMAFIVFDEMQKNQDQKSQKKLSTNSICDDVKIEGNITDLADLNIEGI